MKCPKCSQDYDDSLNFCTNCGAANPIARDSEGKEPSVPTSGPVATHIPKKLKNKWVVVFLVCGFLIGGLTTSTIVVTLKWTNAERKAREAEKKAETVEPLPEKKEATTEEEPPEKENGIGQPVTIGDLVITVHSWEASKVIPAIRLLSHRQEINL